MARRLLAAGWPLRVWARRREAALAIVADGAVWVDQPEQLARECDRVVTILGGSADVVAVHERLLPRARKGAVFLDMTTAAPAVAATLGELAASVGAYVLDCPVTGGVGGAQQGTLTSFVGGGAEVLARCRPLLEAFSQRVVHCGPGGSGYRMKLVNQTMVAGALLGLAGGAALARADGFDRALLKEALTGGTASGFLFQSYLQRMLDGGGPVTFTLALLRKDLQLARADAIAGGLATPLLDCALEAVQAATLRFGGDAGVQCLAAPAGNPPA